ncbi:lysophosphatidylcholine acyltransferase-like [Paramacrobiotus metropolitanus]|uniref:lysophosphatidylcholine acyltransferase-like n=1 Tax=Paramacrobiotus metropolitanus TaxID=2943436 RepID=UPI002445D088|nr:lysophosphatidylcholine acyltransferase-like [Paramacrobiotus metropolitanus]
MLLPRTPEEWQPLRMAQFLNGHLENVGKVVKKKLKKALAFKDLEREDSFVWPPREGGEGETVVTPFSYHYQPSVADFFIMAAMLPILPLRMLLAGIAILVAWLAAKAALYNMPPQVANAAPFTGWRHGCRVIILACARLLFFACAIQRIEYVGETKFQESAVAPVLICAPHVSYLDAFISGVMSIMPVMKAQAAKAPFFGPFLTALQPIYVDREIRESRTNTKDTLIKRCSDEKGVWPPVLIFPEGTTSNGQCLFKFKLGAFYPGQPIQMTSIEYRSCMSTWNPLIMAWDPAVPVWVSILYLFLQPHITARIHIQPVYHPSPEEREDPQLFAHNVQKQMSEYLDIPATDFTYENVREFLRARRAAKRKST